MHEELDKAVSVLIENDVDMIIIEYFFYIQVNYLICLFKQTALPPQEMEWAIELCRKVWMMSMGVEGSTLSPVQQAHSCHHGHRTQGRPLRGFCWRVRRQVGKIILDQKLNFIQDGQGRS